MPESHRKSFAPPPLEIWKCNWQIVELFEAMTTQWHMGMNGPTGLNYLMLKIPAKAFGIKITRSVLFGIQVMESEALKVMSESRKQK